MQPLCSLCLCGYLAAVRATTETQRTQRWHRDRSLFEFAKLFCALCDFLWLFLLQKFGQLRRHRGPCLGLHVDSIFILPRDAIELFPFWIVVREVFACVLALVVCSPASAATLDAGVGRSDVTPPTGFATMGYVRSDAVARGQHTRLLARAIVLRRAAPSESPPCAEARTRARRSPRHGGRSQAHRLRNNRTGRTPPPRAHR